MAALRGAGLAAGAGGPADDEMFDEDAIGALAQESDGVAVPF
jgi:hypothetical protein